MAAVDGGTVALVGEASIASPPHLLIQSVSASLSGEAVITGNMTGVFVGVATLLGETAIVAASSVLRVITDENFFGESTLTVSEAEYLLAPVSMAGEASVTAAAQMLYAGSFDLVGEADATSTGQGLYAVSAAIAGDAEAASAAAMVYDPSVDLGVLLVRLFSEKAVTFDGSDDYITMGNVAVLDFATASPFSAGCWFKSPDAGTLLSKITGADDGWAVSLSGGISFQMGNGSGGEMVVTTTADFDDDEWHFVCVVKAAGTAASTVTIYVDGVVAASAISADTMSGSPLNAASFNLGSRTDGSDLYFGIIDDAFVYDVALSSGSISTIYNSGDPPDLAVVGPTGDLVGYWLMGDGATFPTIDDASSNSNDGTMTSMGAEDIVDTVTGGSTLVAAALNDDQGASDLVGGASVTGAVVVVYDGAAAIVGGASVVALPIIIPPLAAAGPELPPPPPDPFEGLQTGREPTPSVDKLSIGGTTTDRRGGS